MVLRVRFSGRSLAMSGIYLNLVFVQGLPRIKKARFSNKKKTPKYTKFSKKKFLITQRNLEISLKIVCFTQSLPGRNFYLQQVKKTKRWQIGMLLTSPCTAVKPGWSYWVQKSTHL
jgi:hypothetical protein